MMATWSMNNNNNNKSINASSEQAARTQSVNFFKNTFSRASFRGMASSDKSSTNNTSSSSSSLTFFQRLLQNLPAYNEAPSSSSSPPLAVPVAAAAPFFGGAPPAEEKDAPDLAPSTTMAATTAAGALGGVSASSSFVSSIETPLAWAGLDALTSAATKIRQRAADEVVNAKKVQDKLELCAPALEKLEENTLEEEEEEEKITAQVNGDLSLVARWLNLRDEEEEGDEEKMEEKNSAGNVLTADKSGSFKNAGDFEQDDKQPLPLAAAARIQLTALYEDCRQRLDELYERWRAEKEAAAAEAAAEKARAVAAAADGSAGALKRPLTAGEASEIAAAWAYPEGSEKVVCSLPAGAGGSTVDILGKHMAR